MLAALERTQEIIKYSQALEKKSKELEALTQELQQANKQLQELDQLKAEFISTVTHELRTPITSIKAFAKILAENPNLDIKQKTEFLHILVVESERITRLINQVLDVEKIQAEDNNLLLEEINFNQLIKQVQTSLSSQINAKKAICSLELTTKDTYLNAHRDRLTQVLVNLLSNAVKFCDEKQGLILIELSTDRKWINLQISNNGTSIPENEKNLVFERFTQLLHPQLGKPRGSGLGLYISKQIIEQHGGHIKLDTKTGWATSFLIKLPISQVLRKK
jgi:signal transduction histidine kinase